MANENGIRQFDTGANRDADQDKLDYEGFINPLVTKRFAEYMHKNRFLKNGDFRDSDNWQSLFGDKHLDVCIKSMVRHMEDLKLHHRGYSEETTEKIEDSICGIIFNANAYLFKLLLDKRSALLSPQNLQSLLELGEDLQRDREGKVAK